MSRQQKRKLQREEEKKVEKRYKSTAKNLRKMSDKEIQNFLTTLYTDGVNQGANTMLDIFDRTLDDTKGVGPKFKLRITEVLKTKINNKEYNISRFSK